MAKHYVFKSHKSHKGVGYLLLLVVAIIIAVMFTKNWTTLSDNITSNPQSLTNFLLFMMNLQMILLIIIISFFFMEVKDKYLPE